MNPIKQFKTRSLVFALLASSVLAGCGSVATVEPAKEPQVSASTPDYSSDMQETVDPIVVTKIVPADDPYVAARNAVITSVEQGNYDAALISARQLLQRVPANSQDRYLMESLIKLISENQAQAADNAALQRQVNKLASDVEQKDQALQKLREVMVDQ